ncbi:large conductance mechanosensitive channel protein MscL [Rugosimonospora africana]|uniref:Large-conductance mechanosensitive channel n=1 Tax=Rugosimonospora africana TaxID=556532 RepID=A0A8J3QMY8_9ACTN|nr:large conductance mechanosensitive channel protein MscL [Rugosimonospora africana]GIH13983.1 large-conductance mechanosensitive channel [Rugosimonospora africana]
MLRGFKDFIMRGNVVDLAVGIVIGAAFTGLVTQFTDSFLKPLIQVFGGSTETHQGATFSVRHAKFDYGSFINAAITFLLTAAVLYFLVVFPMNKLAERRRRGQEPPPAAPSEEVRLLTDIRDALVVQQGAVRPRTPLDPPPQGRARP